VIDWAGPWTPIDRWLAASIGSGSALVAIAAAGFWLWPLSLEQWAMGLAAGMVAYKWGEVVGTTREKLLQDERDRWLPPELRAAVEEALAARARLLSGPEGGQ
jgi:hypothetical protein